MRLTQPSPAGLDPCDDGGGFVSADALQVHPAGGQQVVDASPEIARHDVRVKTFAGTRSGGEVAMAG